MACRTSVAIAVAALLAIAPRPAAADDCEGDFTLSLFTTRFSIMPSPGADDGLGLDLWARGPSVTWGKRCGGLHRVDVSELDAPDFGDRDHGVMHFVSYYYAWRAGDVTVHAGAHTLTVLGDNLRFVTPVVGVTVAPDPELLIRAQLESSGVFAFAMEHAPRRPLDDAVVVASAVYPAAAATRGELRLRARRYRFEDGVRRRDLLLTAGVGLALGARDRQRALPGFLGLAVRTGDERQLLVVAELDFGLANR